MPRPSLLGLSLFLLAGMQLSCTPTTNPDMASSRAPRNVILFIADGAGPAHFTMARELTAHLGLRDRLHIDPYLTGSVRTNPARVRITDSASSATAYATGFKTENGAIAVDTLHRPLLTILEAAEAKGMATGLVVTSRITHATPAAFAAHVPNRNMENEIAGQMLDAQIDVILGGGRRHFIPEARGGDRSDDRDLLQEAFAIGYQVIGDMDALEDVQGGPVLGLFAESHMPYEIDVAENDASYVPHIVRMTRKAIDILRRSDQGFLLIVEGSRIDHASHAHDAPAALRETLAYDDAFEAARAFAEEDGETLLVAVSDHETGGLALGRSLLDPEQADRVGEAPTYWQSLYARAWYDWNPQQLAGVSASVGTLASALENGADAGDVLAAMAAVEEVTSAESVAIEVARKENRLAYVLGEIVARRAGVAWTTLGHTATDVNLYAYGPGSDRLRGHLDNTDVGKQLFEALALEPAVLPVNGQTP